METITKKVGAWNLEWNPARPSIVWAIPEHLKTFRQASGGIMYDDGTMAWDLPIPPVYVRRAAPQFVRKCQGKRVAK